MLEYRAYDLLTGAFLRRLNVTSWTSTDVLSDAGEFQAELTIPEAFDDVADLRRSTRCGASLVVAARGGLPVFAGIVWRRAYSATSRSLSIGGKGLLSFFDRLDIPATREFEDLDQLLIFKQLVNEAQTVYGATNIAVGTGLEASGVLRTRRYFGWEVKNYGEALRQLAAVENGFDFDFGVDVDPDTGAITRRVDLYYPRRGRPVSETGLQFRTGSNARLLSSTEDGTGLASRITAIGAGEGEHTLLVVRVNTELSADGVPGYTSRIPLKDVASANVLAEHAERELAIKSALPVDYTVQINPDFSDVPWGTWQLGDDATLVVEDDPWYRRTTSAPGLIVERRIVAHRWSVRGEQETLDVGLARKDIVT